MFQSAFAHSRTLPFTPRQLLLAVVWIGAAMILAERLWLSHSLPLWVDETWTAVIASQPTWTSFWREAWLDCNPPLYYAFMAVWTDAAGVSNLALRAPSFALTLAAALAAVLWRIPELSREAQLTWAALLFFWWPGLAISVDARGYSLLLFLSVLQTVACARMLEEPSLKRACAWAACASLAFMTHYYAAPLVAVQALIYLRIHRREALRTWPAALLFLPSVAWLLYHLPRLLEYSRPDVAWYDELGGIAAGALLAYVVGVKSWLFVAAATTAIVIALLLGRRDISIPRDEEDSGADHQWWTALSGVIALVIIFLVCAMKPSLTDRYLTPLVPPFLFLLVLLVRRMSGSHLAYAALAAVILIGSLTPQSLRTRFEARSDYGHERASDYLLSYSPTKLVFVWDHPAAKILDRRSLDQLGSFFLERAGASIPITTAILAPGEDPNRKLVGMASGTNPAILWIYNVNRNSAARTHPPVIRTYPGWRCLHRVRGPIGIVACARPG